jgi:hypothetical protein
MNLSLLKELFMYNQYNPINILYGTSRNKPNSKFTTKKKKKKKKSPILTPIILKKIIQYSRNTINVYYLISH